MPTHHLLIIDPSIKVAEDEGVNELLALWPGTHDLCRPVLEPQTAHMMDSYDADAIVVLGSSKKARFTDGAALVAATFAHFAGVASL